MSGSSEDKSQATVKQSQAVGMQRVRPQRGSESDSSEDKNQALVRTIVRAY